MTGTPCPETSHDGQADRSDTFVLSEAKSAPESPQKNLFRILDEYGPVKNFLGIPLYPSSLNCSLLFNPWAWLFGPFYYLFRGMWRKALSLLPLALCCQIVPLFHADDAVLRDILAEEYAVPYLSLMALSILFSLFYCMGRTVLAAATAVVVVALFMGGPYIVDPLDLGGFSAFAWLCSGPIWFAIGRVCLFSLLGRNWIVAAVLLAMCGGLLVTGMPIGFSCWEIPQLVFPVWCGMMGTWDRYRSRHLKQKFWW